MATGLIQDLMNAYGSAWNQMTPTVSGGGGSTSSNLLDALQSGGSTYVPSTDAKMAATGMSANPTVVPISDAEAQAANAQQGLPNTDPARVAAAQQEAAQIGQAAQQVADTAAAKAAPAQAAAPQAQQVGASPVASVSTDSSFPSPSDYNSDGTQATDPSAQSSGGGLLGSLAGVTQDAAQDPNQAKGLLSSLGDYAQGLGQKLKSLSPAASQGLIASGLTILANNNGRQNLGQLLGQGGIAGLNQYTDVNTVQMQNRLAQQKLAQDLAEKQATNQLGWFNANTTRADALNKPLALNPGQSVTTPGMLANGQSPVGGTSPTGQLPVAKYVDVQQPDGTIMQQGQDLWGNNVGTPTVKSAPYTGELSAPNQKTVNEANDTAAKSALALTKTQNFLTQLMPTIPDPNNPGQTIPNPSYVPVSGGLAATAGNELNKITGGQTQSQLLRSQIQQQVYQAQLGMWKPGIGGRLTNTDVNLLRQGMPPDNASGTTLANYLQAYSHLQEDQATHDALNAQYLTANRGDTSPLHSAQTIAGQQYPAGTPLQSVLSKQSPVQTQKQPVSAQQAQGVISQAQAAARAGDTGAQAALKQRGLSW